MSIKRDLVEEMRQIMTNNDINTEDAHEEADNLLVEFIQDNVNTNQARKLIHWYSNINKYYT